MFELYVMYFEVEVTKTSLISLLVTANANRNKNFLNFHMAIDVLAAYLK